MENQGDRRLILSKAKELRLSTHSVYAKVYIRPDLTKRQLEESKNFRERLANTKATNPEKNWTKRRGNIVEI